MTTKLELKINGNKTYSPLRDKWLILTPEEKVRQEYICKLFNNYGYKLEQIAEEIKVNNSQREQGKPRYIFDLLPSIITVSLETNRIMGDLPKLEF